MTCPKCRLETPPTAQRCDCGYDFIAREVKQSYVAPRSGQSAADYARGYTRNHILGQRWAATILDLFFFLVLFVVVANVFRSSDLALQLLGCGQVESFL